MFSQYLVLIFTISFLRIACAEDNRTKAEKFRTLFQDDSTRERYVNLLKSVINVNEERVNMLKKWYKLQGDGPSFYSGTHLRSPDADEPKNLVVFITDNTDMNPTLERTKTRSFCDKGRGYRDCVDEAIELCEKACKSAFGTICRTYSCSYKSHSYAKRRCEMNCEDVFD